MSQLVLPHGDRQLKSEKQEKNPDMLRSIGRQSGFVESVQKKKRKATVGRICRKGFKPGMKE